MKLTPKQQRFVEEYLVDLNATQAAIRAGYSERTAESQASRLLRNVKVSTAIEEAQKARSERIEVTQDYVLENLTEVLERCMQRAPVMVRRGREIVQLQDEEGRDVWQFDARNAVAALALLGKHVKLFPNRHEVTGKDGGPIESKDLTAMTDDELKREAKEIATRILKVA